MRSRPYAYPVFPLNGNHASFDNHIERRLSALQNKFADREAFQAMVDAGDPLVYEVYEIHPPRGRGRVVERPFHSSSGTGRQ